MVKADVKRDYYADLALSPSAETDAIKKQFRKLALKYHPDRNPGREVEFIAKFQAIQAAHEILVDPQQRLKYDTDRLRAGYGKLYGPPKSDFPPRPSNTKFNAPPQPRRAPAAPQPPPRPQQSASYQAPPSSAGAHRYASYAKAGGQKWEKPYDEAQTRADAFRGFQNMKGNSNNNPAGGTASGWSKFDPRTGQSSAYQTTTENWTRSGAKSRPQSGAYDAFGGRAPNEQFPGMSRSQTTKKKQGFAPGNPGGDEPMAKNTSAYVNTTRERPQSTYFEPAPSPTAKKSPLRSQQLPTEDAPPKTPFMSTQTERRSNQYATTGGEKTYFGRGLDRSASVRNPTANVHANPHTNPPSPISPSDNRSRHHSASPKLRPDRSRTFSPSDSSDTDEEPAPRPKAVPRSRMRAEKLKRGYFAQYNPNQDSGEIFSNSMPSQNPSDGKSASQIRNPFVEANAQQNSDNPSNLNTDANGKTKDDGEWERSKTAQDHINDMWGFPRRNSLKTPSSGLRGQPNLNQNVNSNPNLRAAGANGVPGPMDDSTMYGPSHKNNSKPYPQKWSEQWGFSSPSNAAAPKKPPIWAYPSSVLPKKGLKGQKPPAAATSESNPALKNPFLNTPLQDTVPIQSSSSSFPKFKTATANPFPSTNSFNNHAAAYPNSSQQPFYGNGQSPMKSRSHESINMTFSANDWNGKFEGSSEFFAPKPSSGDEHQRSSMRTRGRTNGRSRSASQSKAGAGHNTSTQPPPMPSSQQHGQFAEGAFFADKWAQELKGDTWTFPHNESSGYAQKPAAGADRHPSPKKPIRTTKQRTNVPKPASVSADADGEEETVYATTEGGLHPRKEYGGASSGGEAMDIDDDIPAGRGSTGANSAQHGEPRLVSVEPNNPEWRASARQGQQQPPIGVRPTTGAANDGVAAKGPSPLNSAKSGNNLLNLSKLNKTAPFTTTNHTGINDLNDLTTTLPFESRSGNSVNNKNTSARLTVRPADLALPKPPKAPVPPKFSTMTNFFDPTQLQRPVLDQKSWDRYVAEMGAYMSEWNAFNRKMLGHFNARQETVETGLAPRWISAVGDSSRLNLDSEFSLDAGADGVAGAGAADSVESLVAGSGKGGYNAYLRGIDEDVVVRKHWDVAWERHRACIIALGELKDWIRAGGKLVR
ncbi:hypothetical protein FQN54_000138 [Arachnomyces sp. PD_36]|nr:hypothetical protein FQN54_000138 [Arachnomyces sp. PD_36]